MTFLARLRALFQRPERTGWAPFLVNCRAMKIPQPASFTFSEPKSRIVFYQLPDEEEG